MFRSRRFNPLAVLLMVVGSFFSHYSVAAFDDVCVPSISEVVNVPFSTSLVVRQDVPIGGVLASAEVTVPMSCTNLYYPTGKYAKYFKSRDNTAIRASNGVFGTSLNGVGLRWNILAPYGNHLFSSTALNSESPIIRFDFPPSTILYPKEMKYVLQHTFELIKVGDVSAGSFQFNSATVMTAPESAMGGSYHRKLNTFIFPAITVKVATPSCFLTKDSVQVNMGSVNASNFRGQGSVTPSKNFSIDLACYSGAILTMTLDNTHQVSGYPGTIKLSSSAQSAKGIGIQVLNASIGNLTPMLLGQPQFMGQTVVGINPIKLAARYIQTGSQVSGGKADGTLTFVFSYL
ncbi:fimbrial protein [Pseudomonas chlororaphis]